MPAFRLSLPHKRRLFWLVLLFISYQLLAPMEHSGVEIPHIDKLVHLLIFALLSVLVHISYHLRRTTQLLVWGIYGAAIELLQGLTPARSADSLDFLANMLGVIISLYAINRYSHEQH